MALLIDPLSLPTFQRLVGQQVGRPSASEVDPVEVAHRVVNVLESQADLSRSKHYRRRVAVLITKMDIRMVQEEMGIVLEDGMPDERWNEVGLENDRRIRAWLGANEPALLQILETRFGDLRFFPVSALGRDPRNGGRFEPKQVLHPLCWLLSARKVMAWPRRARFAGRAAEIAAAMLVVAGFVLPVWLATRAAFEAAVSDFSHRQDILDAESGAKAAQETARARAETVRVAERSRVEAGIVGEWSSRQLGTLKITREGDRLNGTIAVDVKRGPGKLSRKVVQGLHGEIRPDNQVKLWNDNRGKHLPAGSRYEGPFSSEAWIDLSPDGKSLEVRVSEARAGATFGMKSREALREEKLEETLRAAPSPSNIATPSPDLRTVSTTIPRNRSSARAANVAGLRAAKAGRHDEASKAFRRGTDFDRSDPEIWDNLGVSLKMLGRFREADDALATAVRLSPERSGAWLSLAAVHAERGKSEEAIADLEKAYARSRNPSRTLDDLRARNSAPGTSVAERDAISEMLRRVAARDG